MISFLVQAVKLGDQPVLAQKWSCELYQDAEGRIKPHYIVVDEVVAAAEFQPFGHQAFVEHTRETADLRAEEMRRILQEQIPEGQRDRFRVQIRESNDEGKDEVVALLPLESSEPDIGFSA